MNGHCTEVILIVPIEELALANCTTPVVQVLSVPEPGRACAVVTRSLPVRVML